jgi:hypothetical protein
MYGLAQGNHLVARCSTKAQAGLIISESHLYIHGVPLIRYYFMFITTEFTVEAKIKIWIYHLPTQLYIMWLSVIRNTMRM